MDIVDTFNQLIPSDQLDESLIIGQNLECEASNEFGTGPRLEDSLKNMLSDKDPMFGCAGAQFNLLDNEDPAFQIAGTTGMWKDKLEDFVWVYYVSPKRLFFNISDCLLSLTKSIYVESEWSQLGFHIRGICLCAIIITIHTVCDLSERGLECCAGICKSSEYTI